MEQKAKGEIKRLTDMAKEEDNVETRMAIYDSLASYGKEATNALLGLAEKEENENAKQFALSRIAEANKR